MSAGTVAERRESRAVVMSAARPLLDQSMLDVESDQRKLLGEFVKREMVEGPDKDYGVIPGTEKKTLFKPGAEKLCSLFKCVPKPELIEKIERWDPKAPLFYYLFLVEV